LKWSVLQAICNGGVELPNASPIEGCKTIETPSFSNGFGFRPLRNSFNFIRVNTNTLSRHNEPQEDDLRLKEDALLEVSKELSFSKCVEKLS